MTKFDLIKKMLKGSTTMPTGAAGGSNVHYHNGVACNHDHSHDHGHAGHVHDENCNHGHDHDHDHAEHVHDENCKH